VSITSTNNKTMGLTVEGRILVKNLYFAKAYGARTHTHTHKRFTALLRDHPGEPVPEENFWSL